jgi:hypothetical protein
MFRRILAGVNEGVAGWTNNTPDQQDPRVTAQRTQSFLYGDLPQRRAEAERNIGLLGESARLEQTSRKNDADLMETRARQDYWSGMNEERRRRAEYEHQDRQDRVSETRRNNDRNAVEDILGKGGSPAPAVQNVMGTGPTEAQRAASSFSWRPVPSSRTITKVGDQEFQVPSKAEQDATKLEASMVSHDPLVRKHYANLGIALPERASPREVDEANRNYRSAQVDDRMRDLSQDSIDARKGIAAMRANRTGNGETPEEKDARRQATEQRKGRDVAVRQKDARIVGIQSKLNSALAALDKEQTSLLSKIIGTGGNAEAERQRIRQEIQERKSNATQASNREKQTVEDMFGQETIRLGGSYTPGTYDTTTGAFTKAGGSEAPVQAPVQAPPAQPAPPPAEVVQQMKPGQRAKGPDGTVWVKQKNGTVKPAHAI